MLGIIRASGHSTKLVPKRFQSIDLKEMIGLNYKQLPTIVMATNTYKALTVQSNPHTLANNLYEYSLR
jgi:hypothetical protein